MILVRLLGGLIAPLMVVTASCVPAASNEAALIQQIEELMVLPDGAKAMREYSRYYANHPDGSIHSTYVVHPEGWREWRRRVREVCRKSAVSEYPCSETDFGVVAAGESRWVESHDDLPATLGGGCEVISIVYDPREKRFDQVRCNGQH